MGNQWAIEDELFAAKAELEAVELELEAALAGRLSAMESKGGKVPSICLT
jgi:hypothetical protein